jgi:hypothetical protein
MKDRVFDILDLIHRGNPIPITVINGYNPKKGEFFYEPHHNMDLLKVFNNEYQEIGISSKIDVPNIEIGDFFDFLKGNVNKLKAIGISSHNSSSFRSCFLIQNNKKKTYVMSHPKIQSDGWKNPYIELNDPVDLTDETKFCVSTIFACTEVIYYLYFESITKK